MRRIAEDAVRASLPESANPRFSHHRYLERVGIVCGYVDAYNPTVGYVTTRRFIFGATTGIASLQPEAVFPSELKQFNIQWDLWC